MRFEKYLALDVLRKLNNFIVLIRNHQITLVVNCEITFLSNMDHIVKN